MTTATKEPSKEFMIALKELKPIWQHKKTGNKLELVEAQYKNLIELGAKEGLSVHFMHYKLHEIVTNCKECNQQITIEDTAEKLCPDCYEKKQRQEWLEECEEAKRKEDPIEMYCHKIRGTIPYYERPYESKQQDGLEEEEEPFEDKFKRIMSGDTKDGREEAQREEWSRRKEEQRYQDIKNKPEGMTKAQWIKEGVNRRKLQKEEDKQEKLDQRLRYHNSPIAMFEDRIGKVKCRCKAEDMRQGILCKTCRLITKVNQYTLDLFKDAAEGRSTII